MASGLLEVLLRSAFALPSKISLTLLVLAALLASYAAADLSVALSTCKQENIFGQEVTFTCPRPGDPPEKKYCCGKESYEKCCDKYLGVFTEEDVHSVGKIVAVVIGIIIFLIIGVVLCCCFCGCCLFAKWRKGAAGRSSGGEHHHQHNMTHLHHQPPPPQQPPQHAGGYPPPQPQGGAPYHPYPSYPPQGQSTPYPPMPMPTDNPPSYSEASSKNPPYNPSYPPQ
ncbi:unnamed protein product [Cyprideis torosa]|uniref:Uncharacterized protein n=1 Tax=Cyprideis torosa TaxID=163714 RepID=A0A7R8W3S1_9CRUS|nr:unnamed protein product [Cyprideis torosa]CAG0883323.1 unnamed protein product [Cyprideis torosa]